MCLNYIDHKKTNELKCQSKPIVAYKIVRKRRLETEEEISYYPPFPASAMFSFKKGKNIDPLSVSEYDLNSESYPRSLNCENFHHETYSYGFHSILFDENKSKEENEVDVIKFVNSFFTWDKSLIIIKVFIDPKDVIAVGEQEDTQVIVSSALTIKSFRSCVKRTQRLSW